MAGLGPATWLSNGTQVKYFFHLLTTPKKKPRLDHGSPITRRRIFIFLIRRELMLAAAQTDFGKFAEKIRDSLLIAPEVHWSLGTVRFKVGSCFKTYKIDLFCENNSWSGRTFCARSLPTL